jgi:hydroxypyruvate isomerase
MDVHRFLREAKASGYDAVELLPREHWDEARDLGLTIASHGGHVSLTNGLNRRENHARIEDEVNHTLELAREYGIATLICFSGNRNGISDEAGAINTAEGLKRVAKTAESAGVTLVLELLNSKVDHRDYQCDHTTWGMGVVEAVGSPRVKLLYDIYHMQIMEGDIIRTLNEAMRHIGHIHTAGNPGRNDMDETQELYYPAILRAISEAGYGGYVGHEFVPRAATVEGMVEAMRAAHHLAG